MFANPFIELLCKAVQEGHFGCRIALEPPLNEVCFLTKNDPLPDTPFCYEDGVLYFHRYLDIKRKIDQLILSFSTTPLPQFTPSPSLELNPEQQKAVIVALKERFLLLSGGPGSGKSFTLSKLIPTFLEAFGPSMKIVIAAPTGKAASHLYQKLSAPLQEKVRSATLHSLLHILEFEFNKPNIQLDYDLVIVDEASMIDAPLFLRLLEALSLKTRLILVGDPNQLPPIEGGAPFSYLLKHSSLPKVELTSILRTDNRFLLEQSKALLEGKKLDYKPISSFDPLQFISYFPQKTDEPLKNPHMGFKILSSLKKGPFGATAISRTIYQELIKQKGRYLQVPILITKNRESMNLFNGQEGILLFDEESLLHFATFPHIEKPIAESLLPPYEIGYAISIHKSQGSEYEEIVILLANEADHISTPLLYTAITRAKSSFTIFG